MTSILDAIDGAIGDWENSDDAMRWSPRLAEAQEQAANEPQPVLRPSLSLSGPEGPWYLITDVSISFSAAVEQAAAVSGASVADVMEALGRLLAPRAPVVDGDFFPAPPVAASAVLGSVPGEITAVCEDAALRYACWKCQSASVPAETPQAPARRRRRLGR